MRRHALPLLAFSLAFVLSFALSSIPSASAQEVRTGGGGGGTATALDPATTYQASAYRASTATGPGFRCDNTLATCVDVGPGTCNDLGTNVAGELVVGGASGSCVSRFGQICGTQLGCNNTALVGSQLIRLPSTSPLDVTAPQGMAINGTTPTKGVVRASVSMDFASIPNATCLAQSVTVTGALVGDHVSVNADFAMPAPVGIGNARVTATNTVDLRLCNHDPVTSQDPAAGNFIFRLER
jgi:hypothetical protein